MCHVPDSVHWHYYCPKCDKEYETDPIRPKPAHRRREMKTMPEFVTFDEPDRMFKVFQVRVPYCYIINERSLKRWKFKIIWWLIKMLWKSE